MRLLSDWLRRLRHDQDGGETLEYALIAGLIIVVAIAVVGTIGNKVFGRWEPVMSPP